jgi:ubiquinone/menaquinone biosynthesis C-methylase UbiE
MTTDLTGYICPQTKAKLKQSGVFLQTEDRKHVYSINNEIPQFLHYETVESEEAAKTLQKLNDIAKSKGWRQALIDIYGEGSGMYRYVTDTKRLDFLNLLALAKDNVVLEIGPGLGQLTTALAERTKMVYALEVVPQQAEFALERCKQEGLSNVQIASGGDDCWLPYADNFFDVVVINLVLEWCMSRDMNQSPAALQNRMLGEIQRVLKKGGIVYLVTKNRYSLHYLMGKPDEHSYEMPFGNALPRWLLYLMLRLRGKKRPSGFLHSYNQLKRMLLNTGFGDIQSYWAAPEMRYPSYYIPTDSNAIAIARRQKDFVAGSSKSTKLIMKYLPNALVKHFTPGLVFVAKKRG